jgi:hypothetical protein
MALKQNYNYQSIYSQQIYLNSASASIQLNGSKKSNCTFFFSDLIKFDKNAIEMRLELVNAQIPVSWYLINSTNNTFTITVASISTIYQFPFGNYNANTFISTFQTYMGASWSMAFNSITNKFTFGYSGGQFTLSDGLNSIFPIIGFASGFQYTSSGNNLLSPYSVMFGGLTKINIMSSTFNLSNADSKTRGQVQTISSIPVSTIQGGYILYSNYTNFKSVFRNHSLSSINIQIQDDFKNDIDFNNVDWTITLQIDVIKEVIQSIDNLDDVYKNLTEEI